MTWRLQIAISPRWQYDRRQNSGIGVPNYVCQLPTRPLPGYCPYHLVSTEVLMRESCTAVRRVADIGSSDS